MREARGFTYNLSLFKILLSQHNDRLCKKNYNNYILFKLGDFIMKTISTHHSGTILFASILVAFLFSFTQTTFAATTYSCNKVVTDGCFVLSGTLTLDSNNTKPYQSSCGRSQGKTWKVGYTGSSSAFTGTLNTTGTKISLGGAPGSYSMACYIPIKNKTTPFPFSTTINMSKCSIPSGTSTVSCS